jgi:hypothetical protein
MNPNVTKQLLNQINKDNYTQDDLEKMSPDDRKRVLRERLHKKSNISQMHRSGKKNMMKMFENIQNNEQVNNEVSNLINSPQLSRGQKKQLRKRIREDNVGNVIPNELKVDEQEGKEKDNVLNIKNKIMDTLNEDDSYESDDNYKSD